MTLADDCRKFLKIREGEQLHQQQIRVLIEVVVQLAELNANLKTEIEARNG